MPDQQHPLDANPQAARLAAYLYVLLSAQTDEEYAQAQEQAARIAALSDEDLQALAEGGSQEEQPEEEEEEQPQDEQPTQHDRGGFLAQLRE